MIRLASAEDSLAIAQVHVETWKDAYKGIISDKVLADIRIERRAARWLERLADSEQRSLIFVADILGEVVGFVSGGKTRRPDLPFDAELYALYVKPSRQRGRVGRQLTRTLVDELIVRNFNGLLIGVLEANAPARRFYESIGGHPVGGQSIAIGGDLHSEVFYGWPSIRDVTA